MKIFIKPVGLTINDFKYKLIKEGRLSEKSCCCGRLDPQARGAELFLENEGLKDFDKYTYNTDKEYEAEIIIGMSTDTDDIMGILDNKYNFPLTEIEKNNIISKITDELNDLNINRQFNQKFHPYSSFMLRKNGERKPLWIWKKLNKLEDKDIPSKKIYLHFINILELKTYKYSDILQEFIKRINLTDKKHKFRQQEIVEQWRDLENLKIIDNIYSIKFQIKVSSGFYIRRLCQDLKKKIHFPLMIFDINRTKIHLKTI